MCENLYLHLFPNLFDKYNNVKIKFYVTYKANDSIMRSIVHSLKETALDIQTISCSNYFCYVDCGESWALHNEFADLWLSIKQTFLDDVTTK